MECVGWDEACFELPLRCCCLLMRLRRWLQQRSCGHFQPFFQLLFFGLLFLRQRHLRYPVLRALPCRHLQRTRAPRAKRGPITQGGRLVTSSDCTPCSPGTFNPSQAMSACTPCITCPAGTFNNSTGSTSLPSCLTCQEGYYCQLGSSAQLECPAGFYCEKGATAPTPCPQNTYGA